MKKQANTNYSSNDIVQTPLVLAKNIVQHFRPEGKLLEPCRGSGNFLKALNGVNHGSTTDWCEILDGKDFFEYNKSVDWIITNPPWSKISLFLDHGMKISDNIVFLVTANHLWTEHRVRIIKRNGFGIKEIFCVPWPDSSSGFPRSGFQLAALHLKRGWRGKINLTSQYL